MTLTEPAFPALDPADGRGERQVLCVVPDDAARRDRARRRLARVAALGAPHLCPLRRIHECPEGFRVTYDVPSGGTTWGELTSQTEPSVAETVGVGLAVCLALQALHGIGVTHGAVTADRVLIGRYGSVELTDAGALAPGDGGGAVTMAADVAGLAALLAAGLRPGSVGSDLALLLVRAADPDPALRPAVAEIAMALERQCSPEPVSLDPTPLDPTLLDPTPLEPVPLKPAADAPGAPEPAAPDLPDPGAAVASGQAPAGRLVALLRPALRRAGAPRRQRSVRGRHRAAVGPTALRRLALVGALVLGLLLITRGAAGLLRERPVADAAPNAPAPTESTAHEASAPSTAPPADDAVVQWTAVVRRLDDGRVAAMAAGSATALAEVVDPDGPAFARDLETLRARQAAGLRVDGGRLAVRVVRSVSVSASEVTVDLSDERGSYRLLDRGGAVVLSVPARTLAAWRVVLTEYGGSWRIYDATRAG